MSGNYVLLGAAALFASLLAIAGLVLIRLHQRQQEIEARIATVVSPAVIADALAPRGIARQDLDQKLSWRDRIGFVFGFSPNKADQYRVGWPIVLIVTLVISWIAATLAAGLIGPTPARILIPLGWIFLSRTIFARSDAKRRSLLLNQFPDALGLIVRAVRVGIPVTEAMRAVAKEAPEPTRSEFDRVTDQINIGTPPEQALRDLATRNGLSEYGFFAAALTLQAQTGGGLTETLELLAEVIRKRVALKARGYALSAEARTSALVLGVMPIATGCLIGALNPDYIAVLFTDRVGNIVLGIAVLSLSIGVFTMQTIIRKSLG